MFNEAPKEIMKRLTATDPATRFYAVFAGVSLLFITGSVTASACQVPPQSLTGEQYYSALAGYPGIDWMDEDVSVSLIYTHGEGEKIRRVPKSDWIEAPYKKPFTKIRFELKDNIHGGYMKPEKKWWPSLTEAMLKRERDVANSSRPFSFWDLGDVTSTTITGYTDATMCGPNITKTLAPNMHYLLFQKDGRDIGYEPVSGLDDPLIGDVKNIRTDGPSKAQRAPQDYFSEMNGYVSLKIKKCPDPNLYTASDPNAYIFFGQPINPDISADVNFSPADVFKSSAADIRIIDFMAYRTVLEKDTLCAVGDEYLVLDYPSTPSERDQNRGWFSDLTYPRHRFLKVENGHVSTGDILSKVYIQPKTTVPVADIKSWIREGKD